MRNIAALLLLALPLYAAVKPVPPPGVAVSPADRAEIESGLAKLARSVDALKGNPLLPDVLVYHKAVRFALEGNEFFKPDEIGKAKELLREGQARADALAQGKAPWTNAAGLVVRGYVSKIDQSVQPYGLVLPPSWSPDRPHHWRLDAWFHGRNETLSEVNFIADRERNPGEFTPRDTIVLHLYGRYCNANKLAGEVDFFEALADVKRHYTIDERRILVRGFSMGGAAVWHIAAHHAGEWAAAAPGAGFAETDEFLHGYAKSATWYEKTLWHLTNATDYAVNLLQCPTVAYNGEIDGQKQAADIMERALAEEGMHLARVVGPNTAHKYHPDSKVEINRIVDAIAEKGSDPYPRKIRFTTWTLSYNRMKWVVVDGLEKHWERARVDAQITDDRTLTAKTSNVSAISFEIGPGGSAFDETVAPSVILDGQKLAAPPVMTDRSWIAHFHKTGGKWVAGGIDAGALAKRHNLQGPIDDAFLDSFIMVRATGKPLAPAAVASWSAGEQERAIREWRRQFRGEAQVKDDTQITDADIASSNLVLWGDPGSNKVLAKIASRLPVKWTADSVSVGAHAFPAATNALILIYPNPLNPKKYVVLNSGVTFRESDYLNNALQTPKLPDYAVIDITTPPDERAPGKVVHAGFFNERWELQ